MITFVALWRRLVPLYDEPEARAIVRLLLEKKYNMSLADICVGKLEELPPSDAETLEQAMKRLQAGEPIQYVVGEEQFGSRSFLVTPHVLIPRPETLELCEWIEEEGQGRSTILDIGTGSGCIAITLALDMPDTKVTAWDISAEALSVARQNASRLHADVLFELVDVLGEKPEQCYDMIVSNPPYICDKEKELMEMYYGNLVKEAAVERPEEIGSYTKDLPLKIEAEFRSFLEELWKNVAEVAERADTV